jgi:hypothetical protein
MVDLETAAGAGDDLGSLLALFVRRAGFADGVVQTSEFWRVAVKPLRFNSHQHQGSSS